AKMEKNVVTQTNAQEMKATAEKDKMALVEPVNKIELNKELKVNQAETIESGRSKEVTEAEVEEAIEVVTSFINSSLKQVTFSRDKNAEKMIITMIDKETQEVINQFPSEKMISMAGRIKELHQEVENISGLIIDSHV
ncbi:MAG: flagellar protein FlaG, partial [Colwellia sp.]